MSDLPAIPSAALLAEIEALQLRARAIAQGLLAGMHRSPRRGTSIEFSEHKVYNPGDDIRHIDWRAFAKTERLHVKQFEDETNLRVELVVDHSASMGFAATGPAKLGVAQELAAALAYLALRQGDAVGLTTCQGDTIAELPARASSTHLVEVLGRLIGLQAAGPTGLAQTLGRLAQSKRRRSVMVVLTDLFEPSADLWPSLRALAARRHDVAVLHLLDRHEIDFPYEEPATFASMEDPRRLFVHPRTLRSAYVTEMAAFLKRTERQMAEAGCDYALVTTDQEPAQALGGFLRGREKRAG